MQKDRTLAIVIALFLGGIGGEWFYLGKPAHGVISILFAWTFIPAFIALYHIIKFLFMTDEQFETYARQ